MARSVIAGHWAVPVRWTRLWLLSRGHRGRGLFDAGGHRGRLRHVDRVTGGHLDGSRSRP
jgi:hypothetical protein